MSAATGTRVEPRIAFDPKLLLVVLGCVWVYWGVFEEFYKSWTLAEGYYSHGFFVPLVSAWLIWRDRHGILAADARPAAWGYGLLAIAAILFFLGDFLGFRVFGQASVIPLVAGLSAVLIGGGRTLRMWFPIFFLVFMVPIPASMTAGITLRLKLLAAEYAVMMSNALTLPMVQEGSKIHFRDEFLLVGSVCGGLRSLIALLAIGTLVAYISNTRLWARLILLLMAGPIAIFANVMRIFTLCVVGYFYGAETAAGRVHDISGYGIFIIAFALFFGLEALLRRFAELPGDSDANAPAAAAVPGTMPALRAPMRHLVACVIAIVAAGVIHAAAVSAQHDLAEAASDEPLLAIPDYIGGFERMGLDQEIPEDVQRVLETSNILIRPYRTPGGYPVVLTIVHAGSTRRSLHFPEVCLVGAGWDVREQSTMPVGFNFVARRLVLVKGDQTEAVLYWFKTGDHMTGSYFVNSLNWARNQLTFGSPNSAMIKLATPVGNRGEAAAFALLEDFAMQFESIARDRIP
jgi:EpsI family protein